MWPPLGATRRSSAAGGRLFSRRDPLTGSSELQPHQLDALLSDPLRVALLRERLCKDGCTVRFWEGRFKCQSLLDEAAVLACSVYVDLNPIRAGVADRPENSEFTDAYERIAHQQAGTGQVEVPWMAPVTEGAASGAHPPESPAPAAPPRRASDRGFLPMTLEDYLSLLDWTGRQSRPDKRSSIPDHLQPILSRLNIRASSWLDTVSNYGRWFRRAAGRSDHLPARAHEAGHRRFHGVSHCRIAFG